MTLGQEVADPVAAEPVAQSQGAAGPTRVPESEGHGDDPRWPLGFCSSLPKSMQNFWFPTIWSPQTSPKSSIKRFRRASSTDEIPNHPRSRR
jgi:hypothetical protein